MLICMALFIICIICILLYIFGSTLAAHSHQTNWRNCWRLLHSKHARGERYLRVPCATRPSGNACRQASRAVSRCLRGSIRSHPPPRRLPSSRRTMGPQSAIAPPCAKIHAMDDSRQSYHCSSSWWPPRGGHQRWEPHYVKCAGVTTTKKSKCLRTCASSEGIENKTNVKCKRGQKNNNVQIERVLCPWGGPLGPGTRAAAPWAQHALNFYICSRTSA